MKGKYLRKTNQNGYNYDEQRVIFPDLTPQDLDFTVSRSPGGRKKKKHPKSDRHSRVDLESETDSGDGAVPECPPNDSASESPDGKRKRRELTTETANGLSTANVTTDTQQTKERNCPVETCTWKTGPHGGQWRAFYNHVAHKHWEEVSDSWWTGEGRFLCVKCCRHYDIGKQESFFFI